MKNYKIVIGSPVNYKELTAEIVINGEYIALIQKEEGEDKLVIEFYEKKIVSKIFVKDFMEALQEARSLLIKS
jgi:hypothetical protein